MPCGKEVDLYSRKSLQIYFYNEGDSLVLKKQARMRASQLKEMRLKLNPDKVTYERRLKFVEE